MTYVYKLKNSDPKALRKLGYRVLPKAVRGEDYVLYKLVKQPLDGECVQSIIDLYNNPLWQNKFLNNKSIKQYARIGIKFEEYYGEDGELKYSLKDNDKVREMFSLWRLEMNYSDNDLWLDFTIGDNDLPAFYNAELVLDKYCSNEIKELLDNDLIEKVESK